MRHITEQQIQQVIDKNNAHELLEYCVFGEISASILLYDLKKEGNPQNGKLLATFYSAYIWALIWNQEQPELKNVLGKVSDTRLKGDRALMLSIEAGTLFLKLELNKLYKQKSEWQELAQSANDCIASLALSTIKNIQDWIFEFVKEHYTVIKPAFLKYLLGIEDMSNEQLLSFINGNGNGHDDKLGQWSIQESSGLFTIPKRVDKDKENGEKSALTDSNKKAKIEKLVQLATVLEQQRYIE